MIKLKPSPEGFLVIDKLTQSMFKGIVLCKLEVFLICENLYNNNIWINKNKMLKPV